MSSHSPSGAQGGSLRDLSSAGFTLKPTKPGRRLPQIRMHFRNQVKHNIMYLTNFLKYFLFLPLQPILESGLLKNGLS